MGYCSTVILMELKTCVKCETTKPVTQFRSRGGNQKHLLKSYCNSCLYKEHKQWVEDNQDRVRDYRDKDPWTLIKRCKRRGITPEQLFDAYETQQESCAICKVHIDITDSAIDHNHSTNEFRGILCKTWNRAIGLLKDNPQVLLSAREYLIKNGSYGDSEKV